MENVNKKSAPETQEPSSTAADEQEKKELSPTWAQECIQDIDDWIESQGIYLRQ